MKTFRIPILSVLTLCLFGFLSFTLYAQDSSHSTTKDSAVTTQNNNHRIDYIEFSATDIAAIKQFLHGRFWLEIYRLRARLHEFRRWPDKRRVRKSTIGLRQRRARGDLFVRTGKNERRCRSQRRENNETAVRFSRRAAFPFY